MKILNVAILLSILCFCSCSKEVTRTALTGNWEAYEETNLQTGETIGKEPQFLLGVYCSAFELRDNGEFVIYYHRGQTQKPSGQGVSGNWRLENNKELILEFSGNSYINFNIKKLKRANLIVEGIWFGISGSQHQYKLKRN